jgi:outer membrane protein TolC
MIRRTTAAIAFLALCPLAAAAQPQPTFAPAERLSLDAAVRMALEHNLQLQSTRLEIEKAEATLIAARTRRLPTFQTEVSTSQLITPVDFAFPQGAFGTFPGIGPVPAVDTTVSVERQPTMYISSQVSQPLSQLVKIGLNIQGASLARDLEVERTRSARLSIVNAVKRAYFAILQTRSAVAATEDALALYRELDRTLEVRVAQRVALRADALEVQFRLAQEELARTTHQNLLASQQEQLNRLLGRDVATLFDVEDAADVSLLDVDVAAARARALESRPEVREARLAVKQAELDQRISKTARIPDVSLTVSYISNVNMSVMPSNLATAGIRVSWEPFDWGRRRQDVVAKGYTAQQARLALRDAEDRAAIEVNSRFRTLAEKRALLRVAQKAQGVAREKLRVKTNQYQVQAVLLPDVLQVRVELADATDRYQQALVAFWTAKADFDHAIGEE